MGAPPSCNVVAIALLMKNNTKKEKALALLSAIDPAPEN